MLLTVPGNVHVDWNTPVSEPVSVIEDGEQPNSLLVKSRLDDAAESHSRKSIENVFTLEESTFRSGSVMVTTMSAPNT